MATRLLLKINSLKNWQVAAIITAVGLAVFLVGLFNQLQGDDFTQIVNNVPVHSLTNIRLFFEGGTFYTGGTAHGGLSGAYYRPLMTIVFSLIYTIFGAHPIYYHVAQLLLGIGCAVLAYLFFKRSFSPALSLFLSLIFLVHPLDSQNIFAIPSMQDVLFLFFGLLAMNVLLRYKSTKSLFLVALCLFLSFLAKETAVLFVVMCVLYLWWYDRSRLFKFAAIISLPVILYALLRIHAMGIFGHNPANAPIDRYSLPIRLLTVPSILQFYLIKLVFPWKLASEYYWTYTTFSVRHFLLPLVVDLAAVSAVFGAGFIVRKRAKKEMYYTYLFFAAWFVLGLLPMLQLVPVDMTACETWFYFSMVGVLGMVGVLLTALRVRLSPNVLLVIAVALTACLGIRTALRGLDWKNQSTVLYHNAANSPDDYVAYNGIANELYNEGRYAEAEDYASRSIRILPTFYNYLNQAAILTELNDYAGAMQTYKDVLAFSNSSLFSSNYTSVYENLDLLTLATGKPDNGRQLLIQSISMYPQDSKLWMDLALFDDLHGENNDARVEIENATKYGQVPQDVYSDIMRGVPFTINFYNKEITIDPSKTG